QNFVDDTAQISRGTLAELCAASKLNHSLFHETALDSLCREQTTIINLIRCMPADLWTTADVVHASGAYVSKTLVASAIYICCLRSWLAPAFQRANRPIVASDWDRLLKYSPHVKSLECRDVYGDPSLSDAFEALRAGVLQQHLLPRMERLSWNHSDSTSLSCIDLFLGLRITSIMLGNSGSDAHYSLLVRWNRRSCCVPSSELSTFVRALTHVQLLDVSWLDLTGFMHISRLTTLQSLKVNRIPISFPDTAAGRLLANLRAAHIFIPPLVSDPAPSTEILSPISFVCTWKNPAMEGLKVGLRPESPPDQVEELYRLFGITPPATIHPDHFRNLYSFPNLRIVELSIPDGFNLEDSTITAMARSWPYLEDLRFDFAFAGVARPRTTLFGLQELAQHCPYLHTLEMPFDATTVPPPVLVTSAYWRRWSMQLQDHWRRHSLYRARGDSLKTPKWSQAS
ncbi:hypothetical protein FB451DRAFT_1454765, partial [Mycena latifolia]